MSIMRARIDGNYRDVSLDEITRTLMTIDYAHHEVHEGSSFTAHDAQQVTDINKRSAVTFKTPNTTKWAHMVVTVQSTEAAVAILYEDVLIGAGTTKPSALALLNRNRNSSTTSGFISQHSTPVTGEGSVWTEAALQDGNPGDDVDWGATTETELARIALGASINPARSFGGDSRGTQELILKQNTVYMILMTSGTDNDNIMQITLDWYDHTSKS
jgi:hypothetical protein